MKQSAVVLEHAQAQLTSASKNREQYERAMSSTSEVGKSFAELLPEFTDQLDSRFVPQPASHGQMGRGLGGVEGGLDGRQARQGEGRERGRAEDEQTCECRAVAEEPAQCEASGTLAAALRGRDGNRDAGGGGHTGYSSRIRGSAAP